MQDFHNALVQELARELSGHAQRASAPIEPYTRAGDLVIRGEFDGFPCELTLHVLNPYELGHTGDGRYRAHSPTAASARTIEPEARFQIRVDRETPYPIYFSVRPEGEAPPPTPPTLMKKLSQRFLGGLYDVPFGALSVQVSHKRMIEPTRRQLTEMYGEPIGPIDPWFDSLANAYSGQPELTRARVLEHGLADDILDAIGGNAPEWAGIHFIKGELTYSTTVTDLTTPVRIMALVKLLPRLAHSLYDA